MTNTLTINIHIGIVRLETSIRRVQLIPRIRLIHLEILIMLIRLILMRINTHLVIISQKGDGGIQSDLAILLVIDGAYFESVLVSADETGLLSAVATGARAHDGGLGEDAGAAVGVGAVLGVDGGELRE